MRHVLLVASALNTVVDEVVDDPNAIVTHLQTLGEKIIPPLLTILVIAVVSSVILRLLRSVVRKTIERVMEREGQAPRELALKANTLANIIESAGRMLIFIIAGMMVLSTLGVDIAPLIASAGVVGIAIGLGAQSLIKDLIGGFFILFEDQFGVGDVIKVGDLSGAVESMSLRRTALRALDGSFIIIPNGDIRTVTNMTKGWSRAVVDVDISLRDDIDRATEVLRSVLRDLEKDPAFASALVEPGEITGVEALGQYQVTLRILVKTRPAEQWRLMRELRRRIKRAFEENGITIPYPHNVTVLQAEGGAARDLQAVAGGQHRDA